MTVRKAFRHELKYFVRYRDYTELRGRLLHCMKVDAHACANNQYAIRSLYFDDVYNSAYYDKVNGVEKRNKYRIRLYNHQHDLIRLEKKGKVGQYILKESETIPRDLCMRILDGDIDFLSSSTSQLQTGLYIQMKTNLLRPVVIVDYLREAYILPFENVRITFDMKLKTGMLSTELFNPSVPVVNALGPGTVIMEVKFDQFLPQNLQKLVAGVRSARDSISKYVLCRETQRNI